jgi:hypothetical protein
VNKSGHQRNVSLMLSVLVATSLDVTLDELHQVTSRMKHTDAVGESGVRCAGINQLRKAELFDSAKTLERLRLDNSPQHVLELVGAEFD